jgi:F420-non-reducing hydrogenase iron-sulfur subunit
MNNRAMKIYVFCCSNSLDKEQLSSVCSLADGITVKTISLPCSGKVDVPYLMKAFETGADGAVIVTCKKNECQNNEGNLRAQKRAQAVESLLEEIGISGGRMAVIELKNDVKQTLDEINKFFKRIKNLPKSNLYSKDVNG